MRLYICTRKSIRLWVFAQVSVSKTKPVQNPSCRYYVFPNYKNRYILAKWRQWNVQTGVIVLYQPFDYLEYIPRNMHAVFALLCFVVVIHWLIFPYPSGLLHWHCGNLTIAPVPAKQPWWIWINTSCEFIMNDCITTAKENTTKPRAYFLRYTVS